MGGKGRGQRGEGGAMGGKGRGYGGWGGGSWYIFIFTCNRQKDLKSKYIFVKWDKKKWANEVRKLDTFQDPDHLCGSVFQTGRRSRPICPWPGPTAPRRRSRTSWLCWMSWRRPLSLPRCASAWPNRRLSRPSPGPAWPRLYAIPHCHACFQLPTSPVKHHCFSLR